MKFTRTSRITVSDDITLVRFLNEEVECEEEVERKERLFYDDTAFVLRA